MAIEPLPENYSKLEENIGLNGLSNVQALKAAVSEDIGPVAFYVNPIHDGGGSVIEPVEYRTGDVRIDVAKYKASHPRFVPHTDVRSLRLDDIITDKSVLKIDVEGAEVSVLKSGTNALRGGLIQLMVVEVTGESVHEVIDVLAAVEYDCFTHGSRSPITTGTRSDGRIWNIFCLKRGSHLYGRLAADVMAAK